jgi:VWFA-related protein
MTTHEEPALFRTSTNLVLVPVVVRDSQGRPVGDLKQEDFQLFDRGKLQVITKFTIEKSDAKGNLVPAEPAPPAAAGGMQITEPAPAVDIPERFVAYLFDDVHTKNNDLVMARDAADRHMKKTLGPRVRAAIYTTSGQNMLDFTDNQAQLHDALFHLMPHPIASSEALRDCPDLTYFWADRIRNENDQEALNWAILEAEGCLHLSPDPINKGVAMAAVRAAMAKVIARTEHSATVPLEVLRKTVQRMSTMPGQRAVVLASPGFLTLVGSKNEESTIIDRAIRASVVINALDVRGLATETPDPSKPSIELPLGAQSQMAQYQSYREKMDHEVFNARSDVMVDLSSGTGGTFYHNNNDLDTGFDRVAATPEYRYVLGFSPSMMKFDGSVHNLKVSLNPNPHHFELDARRNYSAPNSIADPAEVAKEEIREALFSRDEMHTFPVELHTEYFKTSAESARLSIVAHVDLKLLRFRKEEGRSRDEVTVTAGLFDHNGNFINGTQKNVDLRLMDANLDRWMRSGIRVPASFDVKPGAYVLRLVVRDSGGQLVATQNGVVEIP